jgi:hypothetical protein
MLNVDDARVVGNTEGDDQQSEQTFHGDSF